MRPDLIILGIIFDCWLMLAKSRVSSAAYELSVSSGNPAFSIPYGYFPPQHHRLYLACQLPSFIGGIVHIHVMGGCHERMLAIGIQQNNIGIAAGGESPFAGKEPKDLCGIGGGKLHVFVQADPSFSYAFAVQELHPVFDSGMAVGYLREIVFSHQLLLPLKRTMIRGYHLHQTLVNASP